MQSTILQLRNVLAFVLMLTLAACGGNATDEAHSHEHGDHDHDHDATEMVDDMNADEAEAAELGPEYTSAYVCPMHCEGSGSAEAGVCPVCGMDYVAREDHEADGHEH